MKEKEGGTGPDPTTKTRNLPDTGGARGGGEDYLQNKIFSQLTPSHVHGKKCSNVYMFVHTSILVYTSMCRPNNN